MKMAQIYFNVHMREGHQGEDRHRRDEQEADEHEREERRQRPADEQDREPRALVRGRLQRVERHPARTVLVDEPDDQRRHRPEKERKNVQEGAQVRQHRPRPFLARPHDGGTVPRVLVTVPRGSQMLAMLGVLAYGRLFDGRLSDGFLRGGLLLRRVGPTGHAVVVFPRLHAGSSL